jgi:hypothetical protein
MSFSGCNSEGPTEPIAGLTTQSAKTLPSDIDLPGNQHGFFPLTIGNSWHYSSMLDLRIVEGDAPGLPFAIRNAIDRRLIGTEMRSGVRYVVQEEQITQDVRPGDTFTYWTRYRQDRSGLYFVDVPANDPPVLEHDARVYRSSSGRLSPWVAMGIQHMPQAFSPKQREEWEIAWTQHCKRMDLARRALSGLQDVLSVIPGAALADSEVTQLSYPLHSGSSWFVRPEFGYKWTVEKVEVLTLPAGRFTAYRIRITYPGLGPTDSLVIWFGRSGRLGHQIHITSEATDSEGNHLGVFTTEETETLESLNISR